MMHLLIVAVSGFFKYVSYECPYSNMFPKILGKKSTGKPSQPGLFFKGDTAVSISSLLIGSSHLFASSKIGKSIVIYQEYLVTFNYGHRWRRGGLTFSLLD